MDYNSFYEDETGIWITKEKERIHLSLKDFKLLEPLYPDLPEYYHSRLYIPAKENKLLSYSRPPINYEIIWTDGDRYINRFEDFKRLKNVIIDEVDPYKEIVLTEQRKRIDYKEARIQEYPPVEQLVIALWAHIVENKNKIDSGIEFLEKLRQDIKNKYPKN